jgi:acyl-CoA synthetase (AMP-forming)/AMP-acid ligase II
LPEWLGRRAERDGSAPALRYKRRGVWLEQSWGALAARVASTAALLRSHGFSSGDRLLVDAPAVPAVFRHCLAAWWLGGSVVVLEADAGPLQTADACRFALAGSDVARGRLEAAQPALGRYLLGIQLERSVALASPSWRSSDALAAPEAAVEAVELSGAAVALIRYATRRAGPGAPERRVVTHAELIDHARAPSAGLSGGTRALAGRALSLGAQLETVLGAWLVGGFTLGFVETESTEHGDRRELAPHLLFDTAAGYAALAARIDANLPPPESWERRWLERALDGSRLGRRLITSRLRSVVGFGGARRAVIVGATSATSELQRLLDIPLLEWPARPSRRSEDAIAQVSAPLAGLELAQTGSDVA